VLKEIKKMDKTGFSHFKWINESKLIHEGNRLMIEAPGESDFFCNNGAIAQEGITPESLTNAPFLYTEVNGDKDIIVAF
jgi:hypothetical protein